MGGRSIACLNARDRNLLGFRRDLLTAAAYGVDEFLFVYGDDPLAGSRTSELTVRTMIAEGRAYSETLGRPRPRCASARRPGCDRSRSGSNPPTSSSCRSGSRSRRSWSGEPASTLAHARLRGRHRPGERRHGTPPGDRHPRARDPREPRRAFGSATATPASTSPCDLVDRDPGHRPVRWSPPDPRRPLPRGRGPARTDALYRVDGVRSGRPARTRACRRATSSNAAASTSSSESTTRSASPKAGWPPSPRSGTAMHAIDAAFAATHAGRRVLPHQTALRAARRASTPRSGIRQGAACRTPRPRPSAPARSGHAARSAPARRRSGGTPTTTPPPRASPARRTGRSHATAPGLSAPLVRISSITRSTIGHRDLGRGRARPRVQPVPVLRHLVDEHPLGRPAAVLVEGDAEAVAEDLDLGLVPEHLRVDQQPVHVEDGRVEPRRDGVRRSQAASCASMSPTMAGSSGSTCGR